MSFLFENLLNKCHPISNYSIEEAFVFSNYNVEVKGNLVYYPIYMLMFMENEAVALPKISLDILSSLPSAALDE